MVITVNVGFLLFTLDWKIASTRPCRSSWTLGMLDILGYGWQKCQINQDKAVNCWCCNFLLGMVLVTVQGMVLARCFTKNNIEGKRHLLQGTHESYNWYLSSLRFNSWWGDGWHVVDALCVLCGVCWWSSGNMLGRWGREHGTNCRAAQLLIQRLSAVHSCLWLLAGQR